jgi:hypothetical protein
MQKITKRRIALIQLERGFELFQAGDPISALTLAGAAEEILGRIVKRKKKVPRVEYEAEYLGSVFDWAKKPRPKKENLIARLNRTRNELKHQDDGRNVRIQKDFAAEAESMLLRCMFNHFDAFSCYPANRQLRRWFENTTL